jgi:hypothetical protein
MGQLITPKYIIEKLPPFDLDVLAPDVRPWATAKRHITIKENALSKDWKGSGRIFCNPLGRDSHEWLLRCAEYENCIALIYVKTDSKQYQDIVFKHAKAILFIKGRPKFCEKDGTALASSPLPCALVAFNQNTSIDLENSGIAGKFLWLKRYTNID